MAVAWSWSQSRQKESVILIETSNLEETDSKKTYNSGDSLVVTHLTTSPPVHCLSKAERTGSPVLSVLWSYVR